MIYVGDDYESDSEDEDDDMYVNRASKWIQLHAVQMRYYIPAIGALFVLCKYSNMVHSIRSCGLNVLQIYSKVIACVPI